jgi:predicted deacetylase
MSEGVGGRALLVVLHDVAPQTWPVLAPLVADLDRMGAVPLSLLVVPDYHGRGLLPEHPGFVTAIDRRLVRGDEVLLHGYHHDDRAPAPRGPAAWFMRRVYTREGEFFGLDQGDARRRLERGLAVFDRLGWPLAGFVAPAWLMSRGTREALKKTPLRYTTTPGHFHRLPGLEPVAAPGLVWSARSAWRRGASRLWSERQRRRHARAPVLRLGLHPVDLEHAGARRYWLGLIERLLAERTPLTKRAWLERAA